MNTHRPAALGSAEQMHAGLSRQLVLLLAFACGLAVANLYYLQPVLADVARTFGVGEQQAGVVATLGQLGYALGLLLIVPLGDTRNRRTLIVTMLGLVAAGLIAEAVAPSLAWLAVATFAVGATTVAAQIIIPFAATLAAPNESGKVVGMVMSGLLLGILLARTVSGVVGAYLGWRAMFWIAAGLMLALALLLRLALPDEPPRPGMRYMALLRSLGELVRTLPALREASAMGALIFGAFSAFWVALAFFLETPPYHYGSGVAGLFGLVGVAGALMASFVGRLADRIPPRWITGVCLAILLLSYGVLWLTGSWLWGLTLGVVLLDLGVQGAHISNQTRVYALVPEARSRLNTVYIVSYFLGGAAGSALSALAWSAFGWNGVCALGSGFAGAALLIWLAGTWQASK